MERQINLKHTNITEMRFSAEDGIEEDLSTDLTFMNGFKSDDATSFAVIFELKILSSDSKFDLYLKSVSHFETNLPIDDKFRDSSFVKINAPAIAFPYVRAAISNITLTCGYSPIILPSYNFVNLVEGKRNDIDLSSLPTILE